jgi:hypothetical protein
MNFFGTTQSVVERIAASGCDYQDTIGRFEFERLAIESGIFPAGVVYEVVAMDELTYTSTNPFTDLHRLEKSKLLAV